MNTFFNDVDNFCRVDSWLVTVQECMGEDCLAIEEKTLNPIVLTDIEFRNAYRSIYQTIDGSFIGLFGGLRQCRLDVIDSSYWEISGLPEFEFHMQRTYGKYKYGA